MILVSIVESPRNDEQEEHTVHRQEWSFRESLIKSSGLESFCMVTVLPSGLRRDGKDKEMILFENFG